MLYVQISPCAEKGISLVGQNEKEEGLRSGTK
jgi:hypothetical protein